MEKLKVVDDFTGNFEFLSNFSDHSFRIDGVLWLTNEHFFQAMKTLDMVARGQIWSAATPGKAKRLGQKVTMRVNWSDMRYSIMCEGIFAKFDQNEVIMEKLQSLKGYTIVEGNNWHDNIWGNCWCPKCQNVIGQNLLGKIYMSMIE